MHTAYVHTYTIHWVFQRDVLLVCVQAGTSAICSYSIWDYGRNVPVRQLGLVLAMYSIIVCLLLQIYVLTHASS